VNIVTQKPRSKIIIKNARVIDKDSDYYANVAINNGIIEDIFSGDINNGILSDYELTNAKNFALMPAMVDLHCHFREPGYEYKEDIISGLKAAVKGGYGYIAAMANTSPVADNIDIIKQNNIRAQNARLCGFTQISAIGKNLEDNTLVDVKEISKYTRLFSNDGKSILSAGFMTKALIASKEYNFVLAVHCDNEADLIKRDLELLKKTGGNLHICHVSKKESIELIKKAKSNNLNVTCEVSPHHLFSFGIDYKVNPPIGTKEDNKALIQAVKDSQIDILASDHAPHSADDKQKGSPGISNIETAFSMYIKVFKDNVIDIKKFCEMSSYNPAKIIGINAGLIKKGMQADLIIADINKPYKIDKNDFVSKSNNTPFDGFDVTGKIIRTYIKGEIKYDSGQAL